MPTETRATEPPEDEANSAKGEPIAYTQLPTEEYDLIMAIVSALDDWHYARYESDPSDSEDEDDEVITEWLQEKDSAVAAAYRRLGEYYKRTRP